MTDGDSSAARLQSVHYLQAPCLHDLALRAEETPDAPAEVSPGRADVSFDLFLARIESVAKMLRSSGVKRGDVIAVAMPDGPELLTALLGAVEAGAAAPLDCQLTPAEFRSRLTLLRPSVLLTAGNGHGDAVAQSLGIPVIAFDSEANNSLSISAHPGRVPDECALLLQTSATTGEPKLVPLSHANLRAICSGVRRGLALQSDDRYLSLMPLHHILGFSSALGQLMAGGSVACTGFEARNFPAWLEELRPTWYAAGPALHRAILEMAKAAPEHFRRSSLRFVRCGSGAGSPTLLNDIESVLGINVVNGYGLTEVGPVTSTPPHLPRKTGSVGRSIGPQIAIMDPQGNLLATDFEGEVVLRGEALMEGYLDAEDANRAAFRDGWFRTGDLGRLDHEGDLFITGRIKEIINRGGETISPLEIDHAIAEHPGIVRAASFGVPHPTLGEDIVAAVVLRPGARANVSEVRSFLAERLSKSKVPGFIWFVESIPLSSSGKPLRETLKSQFQARARAQETREWPVAEDESKALLRQRIGVTWMKVLSSDWPDAEDNFFAMGGDSLSAARLFALLQAEFELAELDLVKFIESPTFFQLVQVVARSPRNAPSELRFEDTSVLCFQASGVGPPLFFFPGEGMEPWYLRHLAQALGGDQPFFVLRHHLADASDFSAKASRFVELISRIRPAGPIVLGGHCYGGILAYEVAQRIIANTASEEVAGVLIDVAEPGYLTSVSRHIPKALVAVLRGEGLRLAAEVAEHVRFVRARRSNGNASSVPPAAEPVGPANVDVAIGPAPITRTPGGLTPGAIVLRTYVPRPFPGLVAHALSEGDRSVSQRVLEDSRMGWRRLALGSFQECSLPGSHRSVFDAGNAPALASFIRSAVRAMSKPGTAVP